MINPIWLYSITFLVLILFQKNKKQHIIYLVILIMYLFSALSSVYLIKLDSSFNLVKISLVAVIYQIIVTVWLLLPFKNIEKINYKNIQPIRNVTGFNLFTCFIIFVCLSSVVTSLQNIDINAMLYESSTLRQDFGATGNKSFLNYFVYFGRMAYEAALVFAFYYIVHYPRKRLLIILLLVSSLTAVINGMTVAGREYILKYAFLFAIMFWLSKNNIPKSWKKTLTIFGSTFIFLGISALVMITISKFGMRQAGLIDEEATTSSIFAYSGMGFVNFSPIFEEFSFRHRELPAGAINFPFFAGQAVSVFDLNSSIHTNLNLNQFSTSLGSLMVDGGFLFASFIVLLWGILFRFLIKSKLTIYKMIFIALFVDYSFSYLFFFNDIYNGSRVFFLLVIILLEYIETHSPSRRPQTLQ